MPDAYDHISLMCRLKAAQTRNKEQIGRASCRERV